MKNKVPTFKQWVDKRQMSRIAICSNGQVCYPSYTLGCVSCYEKSVLQSVDDISTGGGKK